MLNIRLYLFANVMMLALTACGGEKYTRDPFPEPIPATEGAITVNIVEFASLPDIDGLAALMMLLVDEPGTARLFVNDLSGILYSVSYDGHTVTPYLDHADSLWGLEVQKPSLKAATHQAAGRRGFQSFAFHPQFAEAGTPGFGKFYTLVGLRNEIRYLSLLEWTAADPYAAFYDGGPPRQLMRSERAWASGMLGFNPSATSGDTDFGLLYWSIGDRGEPNLASSLSEVFGKILRIDPLGSNSTNGQYGIPSDNPFVSTRNALAEIYAYGLRHPQRFGWDVRNGNLFVADIGEWYVEEISPVTAGANLGWPNWEGSFLPVDDWRDDWRIVVRLGKNVVRAIREGHFRIQRPSDHYVLSLDNPRSDTSITYPVIEFDHKDPLLGGGVAITGVVVYRHATIPQLENTVLFGDLVSGEVFYFPADDLPEGGQAAIRRVRFKHRGKTKTLLQMIQEKTIAQGREPAYRADMRFGTGPNGQIFLINKQDGIIRRLMPYHVQQQ